MSEGQKSYTEKTKTNSFNKKRRVLSFDEFKRNQKQSSDAKHVEKGEADLTKKHYSGEKKGDKGIATLDESENIDEAKQPAVFVIKVTRDRGNGRKSVKYVKGTLEDMIGYFGYTLEIGHSHKKSIPLEPKTPKAFYKALSDSYSVKEAALYNRTMIDMLEEIPADAKPEEISDQTKEAA